MGHQDETNKLLLRIAQALERAYPEPQPAPNATGTKPKTNIEAKPKKNDESDTTEGTREENPEEQ